MSIVADQGRRARLVWTKRRARVLKESSSATVTAEGVGEADGEVEGAADPDGEPDGEADGDGLGSGGHPVPPVASSTVMRMPRTGTVCDA